MEKSKFCKKCLTNKSVHDFHKQASCTDGLCLYCKPCKLAMNNSWYVKNKEKKLASSKAYRDKNKHKFSEYKKKSHLKITYGLTIKEYNDYILRQQNKCAICSVPFQDGKVPNIDHNHKTGQIRELLCRECNLGLGNFKDNVDFLSLAIKYLKKHSFK